MAQSTGAAPAAPQSDFVQGYDEAEQPHQNADWQPDIQQEPWQSDALQEPAQAKKRNTGIIVLIIVLVTVVVILGMIVAFLLLKGDDGKKSSSDSSGSSSVSSEKASSKKSKDSDDGSSKSSHATELDESEDEEDDDFSFTGIVNKLASRSSLDVELVSSDVSDYPNVKVYFSVKKPDGESVELSAPKFAVKEQISSGEMIEREVKSFIKIKETEGISYNIAADKSGSMDSSMSDMQSIMRSFVDALDTKDRAELLAFDTYVMYMCTYTTDKTLLKNGINNISAFGETALYDALYEAVFNSGMQKGARCIIAFTDGADNSSYHSQQDVIDLAKMYSVPIFIIGTSGADYSVLENIASSTNGYYWFIDSIYDLEDILSQIRSEEKEMYCLEYVSDSAADAYAPRKIDYAFCDKDYGAEINGDFTPVETVEEQKHSSRYEVIIDSCSWTEANAECIRRGGHLITITSDEEMKTASDLADKNGLKYVWMGGYTSNSGSSTYGHWVTGEAFDYERWMDGEPSRNDKDGVVEMYLMLWKINDEWSWNDQRNDPAADYSYFKKDNQMGYICEYDD
jgi:Mg-chelatase subunit ChlD